ncbi:MAG: ABC transporter permease [Lachnospiraceae bacterium]|nr:ABC transporter permease [Lachnospiraceae bacterium]
MKKENNLPKQVIDLLCRNSAAVVLVVLLLFGILRFDTFLTAGNIRNILRQSSMLGTMAVGMTFVILTGGTDLSVGSVFALSGAAAAMLSSKNIYLGVLLALLLSALAGAVNGIFIAKCNVPPFVATLCMMMALRGAVHIMTNERPLQLDRESAGWFYDMSGAEVSGIPVLVLIFAAVVVLACLLLKYSRLGRNIYAVGGNAEAARMMGLNAAGTQILTYTMSGFLSGLSGLMMCSRTGAAYPLAGNGWEMNAIAAVVLGGTAMSGGVGTAAGTVVGTLIMGCIGNMINLEGTLGSSWQYVINGLALLLAVLLMQFQALRQNYGTAAAE